MIVNSQPFLASATRTTAGQSNGYLVASFLEGIFLVNVTAITGTLTITPKISFDNSTYFTHPTTTPLSITETGQFALSMENFGKYMKVAYTIEGAGATSTFQIDFMGKE